MDGLIALLAGHPRYMMHHMRYPNTPSDRFLEDVREEERIGGETVAFKQAGWLIHSR